MFIRNRTLFALYSVCIRYRWTPIPYSYPHTIRSDSESEKNMVTNMVSLLSVRIRSENQRFGPVDEINGNSSLIN
jgi:hypothetical protein